MIEFIALIELQTAKVDEDSMSVCWDVAKRTKQEDEAMCL